MKYPTVWQLQGLFRVWKDKQKWLFRRQNNSTLATKLWNRLWPNIWTWKSVPQWYQKFQGKEEKISVGTSTVFIWHGHVWHFNVPETGSHFDCLKRHSGQYCGSTEGTYLISSNFQQFPGMIRGDEMHAQSLRVSTLKVATLNQAQWLSVLSRITLVTKERRCCHVSN
jgi:hypothetical protein